VNSDDIETLTLNEFLSGGIKVGTCIYVNTGIVEVRGNIIGVDIEWESFYSHTNMVPAARYASRYTLTFMGDVEVEAFGDTTVVVVKDDYER
jgi:hypothetical protein